MGVRRFCIKICSETSLVVDDTCVEERHVLLNCPIDIIITKRCVISTFW